MAIIVKIIRDSDGGLQYLQNACNYIRDGRELTCGGFGVNPFDAKAAYRQMEAVKSYYGQTSTNPLLHFIVSFDGPTDNLVFASQAAPVIAAFFKDNYQVMWSVHHADGDSAHYHMHLVMNSVNLQNGKLYHSGPSELNQFCCHVKAVTGMEYQLIYGNRKQRKI